MTADGDRPSRGSRDEPPTAPIHGAGLRRRQSFKGLKDPARRASAIIPSRSGQRSRLGRPEPTRGHPGPVDAIRRRVLTQRPQPPVAEQDMCRGFADPVCCRRPPSVGSPAARSPSRPGVLGALKTIHVLWVGSVRSQRTPFQAPADGVGTTTTWPASPSRSLPRSSGRPLPPRPSA